MGRGDRYILSSVVLRLDRCFGLPFPQPFLHSILRPESQERAIDFDIFGRQLCSEGCLLFLDLSEFCVGFYRERVHGLVSDNTFQSLESRVGGF